MVFHLMGALNVFLKKLIYVYTVLSLTPKRVANILGLPVLLVFMSWCISIIFLISTLQIIVSI